MEGVKRGGVVHIISRPPLFFGVFFFLTIRGLEGPAWAGSVDNYVHDICIFNTVHGKDQSGFLDVM